MDLNALENVETVLLCHREHFHGLKWRGYDLLRTLCRPSTMQMVMRLLFGKIRNPIPLHVFHMNAFFRKHEWSNGGGIISFQYWLTVFLEVLCVLKKLSKVFKRVVCAFVHTKYPSSNHFEEAVSEGLSQSLCPCDLMTETASNLNTKVYISSLKKQGGS